MTRSNIAWCYLLWVLAIAAAPAPGWALTAEQNYRLYCVQCHGTLGNGEGINQTAGGLTVSPRDHTFARDMSKLSDQEIGQAITRGGDAVEKSELMPPWGGTISEPEIDELVLHLRQMCRCQAAE